MSDTFSSLIDDLAVDQDPQPETDGPTLGLVVGVKKTEAEFMKLYGGKQSLPMEPITFEDEDGNPETGPHSRDISSCD